MNLSPNFTLSEMIASDTATRQGINNVPNAQQLDNLTRLCMTVLEPLRAALGAPVVITSGLRVPALNIIVGGSQTSDHCDGRAADIKVPGKSALVVCNAIKSLGLPYKQVIHEFGAWCHVSIPRAGDVPSRQDLTAIKIAGRTHYERGLI